MKKKKNLAALIILSVVIFCFVTNLFTTTKQKKAKFDNTHLTQLSKPKHPPQFNFVILVYIRNNKNLSHCLESITKQDYPRDKLAVCMIDDASTIDTKENLKRIQRKTDMYKNWGQLINQQYQGFPYSFNQAINLIGVNDNDIILCVNGSDSLNTDLVLRKINDSYVENPEQQVTFGNFSIKEENGTYKTSTYINCENMSNISDPQKLEDAFVKSGLLWHNIHPKTFKAGTFKKVIEKGAYTRSKGDFVKGMNDLRCQSPRLHWTHPTLSQVWPFGFLQP